MMLLLRIVAVAMAMLCLSPLPVTARPFIFNLGAEPRTLDPGKATTVEAGIVLRNAFEGLTRPMPDGTVEPAAAERFEVSEDGLTWTFHLRRDGRWSNGDPVTAHDFVYGWMRVLDPATASEYAYSLYIVEGAEAYNTGQGPREEVGLEAPDDHTFRVRLVGPTPWLPGFLDHATTMPVHRATVEAGDNWWMDAATWVSNGPYTLTSVDSRVSYTFEPNPHHRDAASLGLRQIVFRMIVNNATALIEFRNGRLHGIVSNPPVPDLRQLRREGLLRTIDNLGTYFICFNVERPPFDNPKVREAFSLAINRERLVRLLQTGVRPAYAFVPPGIPMPDGRDFRAAHGDHLASTDTDELARAALREAGITDPAQLPPIVYIYNTLEQHEMVANFLIAEWRRVLGVTVRTQNMEWKALNQARQEGNFLVSRHGWIGDYRDPMTFLDMWITGGGNNNARWSDARYDALISAARTERDSARRLELFHEAETILMGAHPIAPLFYYNQLYYETPDVEGVERSMMMSIRFDRARWRQ